MIEKPRLESSVYGRIDQVFLSIPSWVLRYQRQVEVKPTAILYQSVFAVLGTDVRFLVVTHDEAVPHLALWLEALDVHGRTEVINVPNGMKLSVWAEDKFTVCHDQSDQRWVLHPPSKERPGDTFAAKAVAERFGWHYLEVERSLQSGNILVGDDFLIVGADSAAALSATGLRDSGRNLHVTGCRFPVPGFAESYESREFELNGTKWNELRYRGNGSSTAQPLFHIDAFLTLAGRDSNGRSQVLVGDPAMAAEALGADLPEHAMSEAFDDIAAQLDEAGFHVVRNPLPLVYQDDHILKDRHWYFASANNALVEIVGAKKTVWLPTYGHGQWSKLEVTDQLNQNIWKQLGFEPILLGDFHSFAVNLGSLRCMTKCLLRSRMRVS